MQTMPVEYFDDYGVHASEVMSMDVLHDDPKLADEATERFQRYDRLINTIYEGPMESPPWTSALDELKTQLDAMHVTLMLRPPSAEESGVMINTGPTTNQGVESYETRFYAMDPFVRIPQGEVTTAEELLGSQWLASPMYREYLEPLGVRHLLGFDIRTSEGIECRVRATRSKGCEPFSDEDKGLCRVLLPHLERAIKLHARLDSLECERQLFAGTVNRLLVGVISLSQSGTIVATNHEARRILGEQDGVKQSGDRLSLNSNQESRTLQKMIARAQSGSMSDDNNHGAIEAMSINRPSGRPALGVLVRPVPLGQWSESGQRPTVAVFLRDPESSGAQPSQEIVRSLFGLTRMESALAILLTQGLTLDEAAEELNVRRNTARTHLRSIFCKTGVTRQTMLVRLLLNSVMALG